MIDFQGCKPLKSNVNLIEIVSEEAIWDLHNAAEFQQFSYITKNRQLLLIWNYFDYDTGIVSHKVEMFLSEVFEMIVTPRDVEMPLDEDTCLEKMIYDASESKLFFEFRGGIKINVKCFKMVFNAIRVF